MMSKTAMNLISKVPLLQDRRACRHRRPPSLLLVLRYCFSMLCAAVYTRHQPIPYYHQVMTVKKDSLEAEYKNDRLDWFDSVFLIYY